MEETFRSSSLDVHSFVTDGSPGAEILRTITEHHIDLVVLGTRGLSKISGFLLGSVSEWVINIPVARPRGIRRELTVVVLLAASLVFARTVRPPANSLPRPRSHIIAIRPKLPAP